MKKTIFTFFVLLLVISSCKKEEMPEPIVTPEPQTIITYASIKSIVDNNCVQCHATAQNTYIADFTSYANLSSYLDNPDKIDEQISKTQTILKSFKTNTLSSTLAANALNKYL